MKRIIEDLPSKSLFFAKSTQPPSMVKRINNVRLREKKVASPHVTSAEHSVAPPGGISIKFLPLRCTQKIVHSFYPPGVPCRAMAVLQLRRLRRSGIPYFAVWPPPPPTTYTTININFPKPSVAGCKNFGSKQKIFSLLQVFTVLS